MIPTSGPILVTRAIPPAARARLDSFGTPYDIHDSESPLSAKELAAAGAGRAAIVCQIADRFDASLLASLSPACRVIATISVGVDHIDVAAAARHGIVVTNTPGVLTEATADLAFALLLAAARRLGEADRDLRGGTWKGWGLMQYWGADVHGATLGVVGGGRIGAAVARRARGFDMRVLCTTRRPEASDLPAGTRCVGLDELLAESDFVTLHVPLNDSTRHLIGAAQLARMKPTAVLINTSRGPVVDEQGLIEALRAGRLAAAGLDVYEHEPHVPPELMALHNVVLLPHIGSATRTTRERMAVMAVNDALAVLSGRSAEHVVSPR